MVYPALLPLMRTPRLPAVDRTEAPRRFKWTRPFRRKTKCGVCACSITLQTQSKTDRDGLQRVGFKRLHFQTLPTQTQLLSFQLQPTNYN